MKNGANPDPKLGLVVVEHVESDRRRQRLGCSDPLLIGPFGYLFGAVGQSGGELFGARLGCGVPAASCPAAPSASCVPPAAVA